MALSCDYGDGEPSDFAWMWTNPHFATTPVGRRRRCRSCRELIGVASDAVRIYRYRLPRDEVECRIYGYDGEVMLAPWWWCETCGGLALSLLEHGYALEIEDDMRELVKEHATLVRIAGDAPCKKALLGHDLWIARADTWETPNLVRLDQEMPRSRRRLPYPVLTIRFVAPSFAAFEAQWQMAQAAHPLPAGCEWRIGVSGYRAAYAPDRELIGVERLVADEEAA